MADNRSGTGGIAAGIADALNRIFGEASPDTLFSSPTLSGDDLIFTAVAWERAGGFGFGTGEGRGEGGDTGSGEGGGGGGVSQGRPVAIVRVTDGRVEVTPVIDFTKIGLTLLLGVIGVWRALRR
jgi:uncharacterized spore protein YtfJ